MANQQQAATLDDMAAALRTARSSPDRYGVATRTSPRFQALRARVADHPGARADRSGAAAGRVRMRASPVSAALRRARKSGEAAPVTVMRSGDRSVEKRPPSQRRAKAARPASQGLHAKPLDGAQHFRNRQEEDVARRLDQTVSVQLACRSRRTGAARGRTSVCARTAGSRGRARAPWSRRHARMTSAGTACRRKECRSGSRARTGPVPPRAAPASRGAIAATAAAGLRRA